MLSTCGPQILWLYFSSCCHSSPTSCSSLFLTVSCLLRVNGSISCLTSRRLHFNDSCVGFWARGRRVCFPCCRFCGETVCLLCVSLSVCGCVGGKPVAGSQTHKPARQSRTVSHHHVAAPHICIFCLYCEETRKKVPWLKIINGSLGWMFMSHSKVIKHCSRNYHVWQRLNNSLVKILDSKLEVFITEEALFKSLVIILIFKKWTRLKVQHTDIA